ncbi:hypothetical protein P0F65_15245 [Sphingomonas sp. I4]
MVVIGVAGPVAAASGMAGSAFDGVTAEDGMAATMGPAEGVGTRPSEEVSAVA